MLVCNVSLRPPQIAIAVDIAESVVAADSLGTGNIVFATLVDDPASVNETVDAYLGEIMLEAASAVDSIIAGSIFAADVNEVVTASEAHDAVKVGAITARQALIAGPSPTMVDTGTVRRQANAAGVMVNL